MTATTFSRNFAFLSAGQFIGRLVLFGTTIYLTRVLSAENFGITAFATSVLAWAALIVDFGLGHYGPLEVARQKVPIVSLVRNVVGLRLLLTVVGFGALLSFVRVAPVPSVTGLVILLYGISLITTAVDLDWLFLGARLMHISAVGEILQQVTMLGGVLAFVHGPEDVVRVPIVYLVSRILGSAFLIGMAYRRFGWIMPGIDWKIVGGLAAAAAPIAATAPLGMVSHNFDLIYIGLVLGAAPAGVYAAAYRVVWVPTLLVTSYHIALRPIVARASVSGIATIESILGRSTRITAGFAFGMVAGGIFLAEPIVSLLFGKPYSPAAQPMKLLLVAFGLLTISRSYRLILVCFHRQGTDFWIMSGAAAINIGLNLMLIPRFGLLGAAGATVASETFILVAGYITTRLLIRHIPLGRHLLRPMVSLAGMLSVMVATETLPLPVRIVLCAASYLVLLFLLRVIRMEDVRDLVGSLFPARAISTAEGGS